MKKIYSLIFLVFILSINVTFAQGSGKNLEFNGSSGYVSCGSVNVSGSALTMMGWIKVDQFNSVTGGAAANISSLWGIEVSGNITLLRLGDGSALAKEKVQFVLYINGRPTKLNGNKSLSTNQWYHLAATYDGSNMRLYINGEQDASMSVSGPNGVNSTFTIGQNYSSARTFDGQMDEISVWKAALSQSTIRDWMCRSIKSTHPNYSNLLAYWKMDRGSGTSITDHSTNSHTGSIISGPSWQTSSAPIGDTSVHDYSSPFRVKLTHNNGDSLVANSITGSPRNVHMYLVNEKPNSTTMPAGVADYDSTRYWGVWFAEGNNPSASVSYYYGNNSYYLSNTSCMIDLARRNDNAATSWSSVNASQSSSSLSKTGQGRSEFIMTFGSNKKIHNDSAKTICDGDSVKLEHSTTGLTYTWFRNSNVIAGATSNVFQAKTSGTYQLVVGTGSCTDTSNTFVLSTRSKPSVSFAALNASCPHEQFDTITGGMPTGGVYMNQYMSGNWFVVKNAGPGQHKITYRFTDSLGCSDTASQIKTVHSFPAVSLAGINPMCADTASFTLNNGRPSGGIYSVNGLTGSTFDANSLGSGKHTIRYDITDNNGCINADSVEVTIKALPTVVFSLFKNRVCEYDNVFQLDGQNPRGGTFSGTGVSGFNFDPKAAGAGAHAITYTYTDRTTQCTNSAVDSVRVIPRPAKPTITLIGDSLQASSADSYQWYDKDGSIPRATGQKYFPPKNGEYKVVVKKDGCSSLISDGFTFDNTNVFPHRNSVGYAIYPNPITDVLHVELTEEMRGQYKVLNAQGAILLRGKLKPDNAIEFGTLSSGNYVLLLEIENEVYREVILVKPH